MDDVRNTEQPAKKRAPAWLRSLAGRSDETVIAAKAKCNKCNIVGPALAWTHKDVLVKDAEKLLFEGMLMKECGHIWVVLLSDNHVRRHQEVTEGLHRECIRLHEAGDQSGAIRKDKLRQKSQKRFQSAAKRAWREYGDLAPEGVLPVSVLTEK